jgi:hypothetical protein
MQHARAALLVVLCIGVFGCHGGGSGDGGKQFTIGSAGGTISVDDLTITIPPGALGNSVQFDVFVLQVAANQPPPTGFIPDGNRQLVSSIFDVEPQATTFSMPVTVSIKYFPNQVPPNVLQAAIDIRQTDPGATTATIFQNSMVDTTTLTVSGQTSEMGVFWSTSPVGPKPATIRVLPALALIQQGQQQSFNAEVRDQGGALMPGQVVTWSVSVPAVASVNPNGNVTGTGPGSTLVVASIGSISGSASMSVEGNIPPAAYPRFENPVPQGNDVLGIRRINGNLVATANGGTLVTQTATGWTQLHSAKGAQLYDVGPLSGTQFAAVGNIAESSGATLYGFLVLSDGVSYGGTEQTFAGAAPTAIASSTSSAMAVGGSQVSNLVDFDGTNWSGIPDPVTETLLAVQSNASGFLVVGQRGSVYQYSSTDAGTPDAGATGTWTPIVRQPLGQLLSSAALANGVAWGTTGNQLQTLDGGSWSSVQLPASPAMASLTNVAVGGPSIAVLGTTQVGNQPELLVLDQTGTWTSAALPAGFMPLPQSDPRGFSLGATSSTDIFLGGANGLIFTYNGTAFTQVTTGPTGAVPSVCTDGTEVFAATSTCNPSNPQCTTPLGVVLKRDLAGGTWSQLGTTLTFIPTAIAARSASEVYAVGMAGMAYKWNGTVWTQLTVDTSANLTDVQACSSEVIAVGEGVVEQFNGAAFAAIPAFTASLGGTTLHTLWCNGNNVVFVGGDYYLARYDGSTVQPLNPLNDNVNPFQWTALWSPDGNQLYAGGSLPQGELASYFVFYDGTHFSVPSAFNPPAGITIAACNVMWGSSAGDLYAGGVLKDGLTGFLLRFDGAFWSQLDPGTQGPVLSITGTTTSGDVYVSGNNGAILRATRQ